MPCRNELFAHCVALTANATVEAYNRRPRAIAHADRLAVTLGLDMTEAGWKPTGDAYLGRVTKARIAAAVGEAKGDKAASDIESLKKDAMVERAEVLLAGTGWLPEPLRTHALADEPNDARRRSTTLLITAKQESAAKDGETAMDEEVEPADDEEKEQEEELEAAE